MKLVFVELTFAIAWLLLKTNMKELKANDQIEEFSKLFVKQLNLT